MRSSVAHQRAVRLGIAPASRYRLEASTEAREGIRPWYLTRYRLLERVANGREIEIWRDERREKYASHAISPEGTVWIVTADVPGPGGGGHISMRRRDDLRVSLVGTQNLMAPGAARPLSARRAPFAPPREALLDLGRATALRLGSGAEQLRFPSGQDRETRLTWLDAHGPSQFGEADVDRFTVRTTTIGTPDPWTEALDRASRPPSATELKGGGALRFWTFGDRTLALRAGSGWFWEWPVRIESVETIPGSVVGIRSLSPWLVWTRLDGAPKLQVAGADGRVVRSLSLADVGYPTAERLLREVDLEDPRVRGSVGERRVADLEGRREPIPGTTFLYPIRDGGRLVLTLAGTNAPRLDRESAATTPARLLQKEPDLPPGGALDERSVRSPSGRFRLRIRRRPSPWKAPGGKTPDPQGYVVLLGHRIVGGRSVEVEMGSILFYGAAPVEARVFDDGRFATVEHHSDQALLMIWNPDGSQIAGIELTQGWYPTVTQAKREFRIDEASYRSEGAPRTFEVAGVPIRETASASWTLPKANGTRVLHLARMADGSIRTWWQD